MLEEKLIDENYKVQLEDQNKISLFFLKDNIWERAGCLIFEYTNYILLGRQNDYCNLINMHVFDEHQNKKLGHAMFEFLMEILPNNVYALLCHTDKILNKVQVPKIFGKHDPMTVGKYEVILNKNFKEIHK